MLRCAHVVISRSHTGGATIFVLHESSAMRRLKNVTVTLDPETARWARIEAAKGDTSVSRLIGEILQREMEG